MSAAYPGAVEAAADSAPYAIVCEGLVKIYKVADL
jgi:hypothetical protein